MSERDHGQGPDMSEVVRQVNEVTDSEPVNGEDLLESEDLKRQLREAKEREAQRKQGGATRH
jgi:hypothetical protein